MKQVFLGENNEEKIYRRNTFRSLIVVRCRSMTAEAAAILNENEKLSHRLETPGDVKTIREIAEEELDLVTPDTVLIELQ